jgi:uncharacterized protein (TIGR02270 family)
MSTAATPVGSRVLFRIAEDAVFLWLWRDAATRAPNVRLLDLVRRDERLEAHCHALSIGHDEAWELAWAELSGGGLGATFAVTRLAIANPRPGPQGEMLDTVLQADEPEAARPAISALAWTDRAVAAPVMHRLLVADDLRGRAIAIAALGARRSDPGPALAAVVMDQSPSARARAYRTTGQLGRADLMAQLAPGLTDPDPECRFWSAWSAARMGAGQEALGVLAEIAWTNQPRATRALDLLLRRLFVPHAHAWLREFAKLPGRQRDLMRATGVVGDPLYIPWLIERMTAPETARLAGEAFSMITGLDLAYRDLDRRKPEGFESGPNDDPKDENVALDEDDNLPWPDPTRIGNWWTANRDRFSVGTPYFLGQPKPAADWLEALSDAFQRQRHAAALELAIRQPNRVMFEVRARGRLQRQLLARARGAP